MDCFDFLLVDDEREFVDPLAKRLRQRGFSPELDGIQTLSFLKEKHPLPEVIMLTGHASVASAVEALKKAAFDYLTKPCDLDDVITKAERAVFRKKERAAKIRQIQTMPFISDREREKRIKEILKVGGV